MGDVERYLHRIPALSRFPPATLELVQSYQRSCDQHPPAIVDGPWQVAMNVYEKLFENPGGMSPV